ncbi:hypothetical protein [Borborobacter arsenicus]|uniref:hypothetical protein n=1 Tax=Borborobacter arsenicus TaxID=1851146 RepID=UPI00140492BF|nr:hypothetical protein [Pseudaminobacter arsenicus]
MARTPATTSDKAAIHDQKLIRGNGGELDQIADGEVLTTAQMMPVSIVSSSIGLGS